MLRIPNSAQWIGTLTGVLYPLCFASAWTDEDGGITPDQAAERFTQLFNEYLNSDGICDMGMFDVRQSATDPCILEKTDDGGLVWQPFAMLDLCAALQPKPDTKLPSLIRYNDDTDAIEYSLDGGETWVEAIPPTTPETNPWTPPRIPAEGATDALKRCNAANRAVGNLSDMYRQTYGAVVAGIANTLTDFSKFVAELADVVFGVVYGYWYTIPDLLLDYWFGPEVYNYYTAPELPLAAQEDLLCLLYQYSSVSGDGVVSFDFGAVRDNVIDVLGINPGIAVWSHLNYLGEAGLNRLGDIGFGAGLSCDPCLSTWCYTFDFRDGQQGWSVLPGEPGAYVAGQGWQGTLSEGGRICRIHRVWPNPVDITRVEYETTVFNNANGNLNIRAFPIDESRSRGNMFNGTFTGGWDVNWPSSVELYVGHGNGTFSGGGNNFYLRKITVYGTGANPFGADNC